jgi:hypothetical protein
MYVYDTLEDFELDEGEEELTLYIKKESSFLTNGYDHNELFGKVVYTTY